jgi:sulfur transfer protein SufE
MSHPAPPDAGAPPAPLPPTIARVLDRFRALGREEKMQALVGYAKKLEPVPARYADVDRARFTVPECQTRVDLFPEVGADGTLRFYADVNARQSPTIAGRCSPSRSRRSTASRRPSRSRSRPTTCASS